MTWIFNEDEFTEPSEDHVGFVYLITEISTGKKYIGKKLFWRTLKLKPLKGKTRSRKVTKQSDWMKYYGSSLALQNALAENGPENYKREILHMCRTKGEMSYIECVEQIQRKVLFREDYYNEFIGVKIHSKHVKGMAQCIIEHNNNQ